MYLIKKIINSALENSKLIKSKINYFSKTKKPVLIIGDGISSMYVQSILCQYEYIIICNLSILNQKLYNLSPLYWVLREPSFLLPNILNPDRVNFKKETGFRKLLVKKIKDLSNTVGIFHPKGRLFNFYKWKIKNSLFLSPKYEFKLESGDIYNFFDGALQTCLGMALLSGFKNIHCVGFDAWLLNPKNNLRWYSKCSNPDDYDQKFLDENCPDFLKIASKNSIISVYSYRHYKVKYKILSEIKSTQKFIYIPQIDMEKYMDLKSLMLWREEEASNKKHPNGYNVKK
jgi:hypothetical protein